MATGICTEIDHSTGQIVWLLPNKEVMQRGEQLWHLVLFFSGLIAAPLLSQFADLTVMLFCAPILIIASLFFPFQRTLNAARYTDRERAEVKRRAYHSLIRFSACSVAALSVGWGVSLTTLKLLLSCC